MRFAFAAFVACFASPAFAAEFPRFKTQEIDKELKSGCAVLVTDIDGDKKPDIVVVDQHKVVWYKNPGKQGEQWKKYTILDGKTRPDNVCIAAIDLDADGLPELVLGAGWKPSDTTTASQLVWLKRGKDVTREWSMHELPCDEPTVHRLQIADIDNNDKPAIIVAPLKGRDSTERGHWMDGKPVRIVALRVPAKDLEKKESWKPDVLSEELKLVHNIDVCYQVYTRPTEVASILTASSAGVHAIWMGEGKVIKHNPITFATKDDPDGTKPTRDLSHGYLTPPMLNKGDGAFDVTIETWDGTEVAVYPPSERTHRVVIDKNLRFGSALRCADLDGDGGHEIILGVRDNPNPRTGDKFKERRGVRIYKSTDEKGEMWERRIIDDGGIAVADLAIADLDGDGRADIIAIGRETGNVRIYWNQGK